MQIELLANRTRHCPKEIQDYLTAVGGTNIYGQPNFRFVWAQTRTTRAVSTGDRGKLAPKVREILKYDDEPVWHLEKWCDPSMYGTPETWMTENRQPETNEPMLGPYPFQGEYESCHKYNSLSYRIVTNIVPMIKKAREMDYQERLSRIKAEQEKKDKAMFAEMDDKFDDMAPAFANATSFHGQKNCASYIDRTLRKKPVTKSLQQQQKESGWSGGFQVRPRK